MEVFRVGSIRTVFQRRPLSIDSDAGAIVNNYGFIWEFVQIVSNKLGQ